MTCTGRLILAAAGLSATVATGCQTGGQAQGAAPVEVTAPSTTSSIASTAVAASAERATATTGLRSGDTTDVALLASEIADGTAGEPEWIEVMANLRAVSWLLSRYPGHYDADTIYADGWAGEIASPNIEHLRSLGVYLDEPLPRLLSVVRTGASGPLIELDVLVTIEPAVVRREADDGPTENLPGGTQRGLYTVAQDGPDGGWRIHSVVELQLTADPSAEDPTTPSTTDVATDESPGTTEGSEGSDQSDKGEESNR